MAAKDIDPELKRGSTELLLLALLEDRERHGYQLAQLIEARSRGAISFRVASLYPILYRMEEEGLIAGRWLEKPEQRRRRVYKITAVGRRSLAKHRRSWADFIAALTRITGIGTEEQTS